jgi:hypothetical protein
MVVKSVASGLIALGLASPTIAQEFSGGELGVEFNAFADDTDVNGTSYSGGVEFSFGREYAIAVTAENFGFGGESTTNNVTLHGIYHLNQGASLGLFYSQNENNIEGYGFEGGTNFGGTDIGGYIGQKSFDGEDVVIAGLESRTPINSQITFFTDFDIVGDDDVAGSTSELGVSYLFDAGPEAYVQVGSASAFTDFGSASEAYIGVGAKISFGAARGTTFDTR